MEDLSASGESASKPGMAEMMGVGLLAHHLLTSAVVSGTVAGVSEAKFDTVEDDGRRMADKIAVDLGFQTAPFQVFFAAGSREGFRF